MATEKKSKPLPSMLTVSQAGAVLGVSASTMRRYERDGLISALRTPSNQRRFRRSEVEALATRHEPA